MSVVLRILPLSGQDDPEVEAGFAYLDERSHAQLEGWLGNGVGPEPTIQVLRVDSDGRPIEGVTVLGGEGVRASCLVVGQRR